MEQNRRLAPRFQKRHEPPPTIPFNTEIVMERFNSPDLTVWGGWLLERLKEFYPHLTDQTLAGWLRASINSNEAHIVHSGMAIGMAQITHEPLEAQPSVKEVFVFCRSSDDETEKQTALKQGAAIYSEFRRWGMSLGAKEFVGGGHSDVPRELIEEEIGKIFVKQTGYIRLPQQ